MKRILTLTDAFERGAHRYKFKRTVALVAVILALGFSYAHPADNDDQTSDDWRRWCNMEGVKDPLWDCDALRRGEIRRRHMEQCSADYAKQCDDLEHETDWLRGPK